MRGARGGCWRVFARAQHGARHTARIRKSASPPLKIPTPFHSSATAPTGCSDTVCSTAQAAAKRTWRATVAASMLRPAERRSMSEAMMPSSAANCLHQDTHRACSGLQDLSWSQACGILPRGLNAPLSMKLTRVSSRGKTHSRGRYRTCSFPTRVRGVTGRQSQVPYQHARRNVNRAQLMECWDTRACDALAASSTVAASNASAQMPMARC